MFAVKTLNSDEWRIKTSMAGLPIGRALGAIGGALIIITITLIFGSSLFNYVSGLFVSASANVVVSAQAQIFINPSSGQGYMTFTIKNNGNVEINLTTIQINGQKINENISLSPGDSYQGIIPLPQNLGVQPGAYYTVIFSGKAITGKPFATTINVLASTSS